MKKNNIIDLIEEKELNDLFTTPLFKAKLSLDNKKILSFCHSLKRTDQGRQVSNVGGWQSNDLFESCTELNPLFDSILNISEEVCQIMDIHPVKLHNSWVNINRYKDCNWPHTHDDSILSGVYYVKTPENCGNIQFENPNISGYLRFINYNRFNTSSWWMPSTEGTLYIFPSWIRHGVQPNLNEKEERVSISFNLIH